jgi:hypothetical protein
MNEKELEIRIESNDSFHVPAGLIQARWIARHDFKEALHLLNSMFDGLVKVDGLMKILRGNIEPVFNLEDLTTNSLTFRLMESQINMELLHLEE